MFHDCKFNIFEIWIVDEMKQKLKSELWEIIRAVL